MPISVASRSRLSGLVTPLRAIVRATLAQEGRMPGEIAVVITDDAELREINCSWRGIDRATDVISFTYDDDPRQVHVVSGDLVVSLDRVFEQARRFRVTPGAELARLVVHGTLHLAGHDHQRAGQRKMMRGREDRAMGTVKAQARALDRPLAAARALSR